MTTRIAPLLLAPALLLATGCSSDEEFSLTPMPDAVALARTTGPTTTTVTLPKAIDGMLVNVTCNGKGHVKFRAVVGSTGDAAGDMQCPGTTNLPDQKAPQGAKVTLTITVVDGSPQGVIQLAPPQS